MCLLKLMYFVEEGKFHETLCCLSVIFVCGDGDMYCTNLTWLVSQLGAVWEQRASQEQDRLMVIVWEYGSREATLVFCTTFTIRIADNTILMLWPPTLRQWQFSVHYLLKKWIKLLSGVNYMRWLWILWSCDVWHRLTPGSWPAPWEYGGGLGPNTLDNCYEPSTSAATTRPRAHPNSAIVHINNIAH